MKSNLFIHHKYKIWGWVLFVPSLIVGILRLIYGDEFFSLRFKTFAIASEGFFEKSHFFQIIETDMLNTLIGSLIILGGLIISFSIEKVEDEFIQRIRLSSIQWAFAIHFLILLFCFIFIYGEFFWHVMVIAMFASLIIFIGRFHYLIYVNQKN